MRDDREFLARARAGLRQVPAPKPELGSVRHRARVLRVRRLAAEVAVVALVAAGILVPLGALHLLRPPGTDHQPATGAAPVLDFESAPGWNVVKSDPVLADQPGAPQVWAANVPFADDDHQPGLANGYSGGSPEHTIRTLPPDGIVITASLPVETRNPLPDDRTFPSRTLPLHLENPPTSGWEGQPREDLSISSVNASVRGWWISLTVVFGTKDPSDAMVGQANDEVARLIMPPAPQTTPDFDQFGISLDRPSGWYGSLTAWSESSSVLETATVPITDLYDGSSARRVLGLDDLFLVLAENDALATRYEPVTLPIAIRPEDVCPTCEINDDGTSPPAGHTLFYRSFATGNRQFDLWVEFGTADVTAAQLPRVNDVLATLRIAPGPSVPPLGGASSAPRAPVSVDMPNGWSATQDPVPAAVDPRVVAAYGTWDFPSGGECGPEPALRVLPSDGAFVWVEEYADPSNSADFEPGGPPRNIDLQTPPARWECAAAAPSRKYLFRDAGRFFELHVALGPNASMDTIAQAEHVVASFSAVRSVVGSSEGRTSDACPSPTLRPTYLPWLGEGQAVPEPIAFTGPGDSATVYWSRPGATSTAYVRLTRQSSSLDGSGPGEPVAVSIPGASNGQLYEGETAGTDALFWETDRPTCSEYVLELTVSDLTRAESKTAVIRVARSLQPASS